MIRVRICQRLARVAFTLMIVHHNLVTERFGQLEAAPTSPNLRPNGSVIMARRTKGEGAR
jgi:hypothetical protein